MKYKKAITALALAALLLAGCVPHRRPCRHPPRSRQQHSPETQSGVTFTDAMGYPVTVQSWNRVVSLYGKALPKHGPWQAARWLPQRRMPSRSAGWTWEQTLP